jgi:hypothetical protein
MQCIGHLPTPSSARTELGSVGCREALLSVAELSRPWSSANPAMAAGGCPFVSPLAPGSRVVLTIGGVPAEAFLTTTLTVSPAFKPVGTVISYSRPSGVLTENKGRYRSVHESEREKVEVGKRVRHVQEHAHVH